MENPYALLGDLTSDNVHSKKPEGQKQGNDKKLKTQTQKTNKPQEKSKKEQPIKSNTTEKQSVVDSSGFEQVSANTKKKYKTTTNTRTKTT